MKRYYSKGNYWYDIDTLEIDGLPGKTHVKQSKKPLSAQVISDHAAYKSPITGETIDGRAQRREHMKKYNLREVDNSEFRPVYRNPEFCAKRGISPDRMGDPLPKPTRMTYDTPPQGLERLLRR